jgi:iron complex outermembrane recepter protein
MIGLNKCLLASSALLGVVCSLSGAALAAAADSENAVETVIVTGSKTNERQIDVAIPISVISADKLTLTNSVHLEDYAASMPGLSVTSQGNGRSGVVIRGITTGNGNNPTVGITINDVPIGSNMNDTIIPDLDPNILSSVEVLRGPQGSLYGASSMGGLIRYVTVQPSLTETSGSIGVSGSTVAEGGSGYGFHAMLTTPLVENTVGLQVSSFYRFDPGYIKNIADGKDNVNTARTVGGRIALLWQVSQDVSYELAAIFQTRKANGTNGIDVNLDRSAVDGNYYSQDRVPGTGRGYMNLAIYSGTLKADFGFADLTAITAFNRTAFNGPQDVSATFDRYLHYFGLDSDTYSSVIKNYSQSNKFSQEIRLASKPGSDLEWMVGGFFTHEAYLSDQVIYVTEAATGADIGFPDLNTAYSPSAYTEYAAFGSVIYHFTSDFDLLLGARISALHQFYHEVDGGLMADAADDSSDSSANVFTWTVTPRYHISEDIMVYARVATGYRPGGPNSAANAPASYGPDRTTNYEVGFKGILVPDLLTVDASLFDIEWKNIQLQAATAGGYSYIQNGGAARSRGLEISTSLTPLDGLSINANFAYAEAVLTEDVNNSSLVANKGERLPYSSKTSGSLSVDQKFNIVDDINGSVGMTFNYYGSRYAVFPKTSGGDRFFVPAYGTVDLRAGVDKGDWAFSVYSRNVFDQVGFMYASSRDVITRTGSYNAGLISPRTVGVSLSRRF